MHLIISIALGIFGGLWLFVRWGEWRVAAPIRQVAREQRRERRLLTQTKRDETYFVALMVTIAGAVLIAFITNRDPSAGPSAQLVQSQSSSQSALRSPPAAQPLPSDEDFLKEIAKYAASPTPNSLR